MKTHPKNPRKPAAPNAEGIVILDKDHGTETNEASVPAVPEFAGYSFAKATPEVYASNIRTMVGEVNRAYFSFAVNLVLVGQYCREVQLDLKLKGEHGFQNWLATHVPELRYERIRQAMKVAGETFRKTPELFTLDSSEKVLRVAQLVDGREFVEYGRDIGALRRPANHNEDGKRLHHPSAKTDAERAEDAAVKRAKNMADAIDALQIEVDHGNFDAFTDEEAEIRLKQLEGICAKIRDEVIAPRAAAKKRAGNSRRPARDL